MNWLRSGWEGDDRATTWQVTRFQKLNWFYRINGRHSTLYIRHLIVKRMHSGTISTSCNTSLQFLKWNAMKTTCNRNKRQSCIIFLGNVMIFIHISWHNLIKWTKNGNSIFCTRTAIAFRRLVIRAFADLQAHSTHSTHFNSKVVYWKFKYVFPFWHYEPIAPIKIDRFDNVI